MKKGIIIGVICLILVGGLILLFISDNNKEKVMVCSINGKTTNGTEVNTEYTIKYTGQYVDEVESVEKAKTKDTEALKAYKASAEEAYQKFDSLKYYDYNIYVNEDTIISTVIINYSRIDTNELIRMIPDSNSLIKDGKINIHDIQKSYESTGATCK